MTDYCQIIPGNIYWVDAHKELPQTSRQLKIMLTESHTEVDVYYDANDKTFKSDNCDYSNIVFMWRCVR